MVHKVAAHSRRTKTGRVAKKKNNNIALGVLFASLIAVLIGISLFAKLVSVFQQGKFDSSYPYTLRVEAPGNTQFISLFPKQDKITIVNVSDTKNASSLEIPQDYQVSLNRNLDSAALPEFFKNNSVLASIDKARLYLFVKSISSDNIKSYNISPTDPGLDKTLLGIYSDPQITSEDLRVEVINSTGVYGVGNNVAKLLSNVGANVIFVKTGDEVEKKSMIYYSDKRGYTVSRFEKLLSFPSAFSNEKSISDVVVIIGEDASKFIKN